MEGGGGLGETISPARAWVVMGRGNGGGFTNAAVQNHLRTFAIAVVKHKQLATIFGGGGLDGENVLVEIVCYLHGARPEPGVILSIERFSAASCLALAKWDTMYYALIAEVRSQYALASHADSKTILHTRGTTGDATDQPFRVDDLLVLLSNIWSFLADPRLLGPLEAAVRLRNVGESFSNGQIEHEFGQTFEQAWHGYSAQKREELLNSTEGLVDVSRMSVGTIERAVRKYCVGTIRRADLKEQNETVPRADQEEALPAGDQWPQPASPPSPPTDESPCCCLPGCVCQLVCQYGIHECQCKTTMAQTARREARSTPVQNSSSPPVVRPGRARTNTSGSQQLHGVYQPPRRHQGKQVFPTEFYADHRGSGRYPRFAPSSTEPSSSPPPAFAAPPPPPPRDENPPLATALRPSFSSGRRLVSAGGDLPLSEREVFPDDHLPQPEERGWAMTKEEFEALPTPRRPSDAVVGEAGPPRRSSWVKRVFSRSGSYTR